MSEENVGLIHSVYEPLNREDWDEVFRNAHPEMELITQRGPAAGTFRGQEAIKTQVREAFAAFEAWRIQPEEFFEVGDHVVVYVKVCSQPRGSSVEMEVRNAHLWTLRDGTIWSLKTFAVREEALEAAGLEE